MSSSGGNRLRERGGSTELWEREDVCHQTNQYLVEPIQNIVNIWCIISICFNKQSRTYCISMDTVRSTQSFVSYLVASWTLGDRLSTLDCIPDIPPSIPFARPIVICADDVWEVLIPQFAVFLYCTTRRSLNDPHAFCFSDIFWQLPESARPRASSTSVNSLVFWTRRHQPRIYPT